MKKPYNQSPHEYRPTTDLEKKAIFLEETLEKLISFSDHLFRKIKILEKKKLDTTELKEKRKDVLKGINEVFEKANTIWKDIKNESNRITTS